MHDATMTYAQLERRCAQLERRCAQLELANKQMVFALRELVMASRRVVGIVRGSSLRADMDRLRKVLKDERVQAVVHAVMKGFG